ncbi:MAG: hypothetical protein LBO08_02285 [Rickettsiales bacterium]|jgi:hypothetical protein|nr:hypothetical protein [Rickettsiales bacterium]
MKKFLILNGYFLIAFAANAAESNRIQLAMQAQANAARMPSVPTLSIGVVGNIKQGTTAATIQNPAVVTPTPITPPTPPEKPDKPEKPGPDVPKCLPSGYTITNCMNDLQSCITGGGLANGLATLYDRNISADIIVGMNLCRAQVDFCIANITKCDGDDKYQIYCGATDVWRDFLSRVITPAYYNFVLQNTGLTPNQAENTCLLLDRNVYGSGLAGVSDHDKVTTEYDIQVGAYNGANGNVLIKNNPLGSQVNTTGINGQRGYYARWDATAAQCSVRVAAYNGGKMITNDWLFGIAGDERPAEAWKKTGDSFICNGDLFEFSLLNTTYTIGAVAMPGGAVAGSLIGYGVEKAKKLNCKDEKDRLQLHAEIVAADAGRVIGGVVPAFDYANDINLTEDICNQIASLPRTQCAGVGGGTAVSAKVNDTAITNGQQTVGNTVVNASGLGSSSTVATSSNCAAAAIVNNLKIINAGNTAKGAVVGGLTGLAAGGAATLISSFLEKNNISCSIGDGLEKIGYGKTGRIKSLKEYYVMWNLNLPDAVRPNGIVNNCNDWKNACASVLDLALCPTTQISYQNARTIVDNACAVRGGNCVESISVAVSQGACVDGQGTCAVRDNNSGGNDNGNGEHGGGHGGNGNGGHGNINASQVATYENWGYNAEGVWQSNGVAVIGGNGIVEQGR